MKIKSLLLGSAAVLGLSTGAFAADPMEMLSLGLCDGFGSLWNSGSTINPNYEGETHCVRVTGGAKLEFNWGNYTSAATGTAVPGTGTLDWSSKVEAWMRWIGIANGTTGPVAAVIKFKEVQQYVVVNEGVRGTGTDHTGGVVLDEGYAQAMIGDNLWIAGGKKGSLANLGGDGNSATADADGAFTIFKLSHQDTVDGVGFSTAGRTFWNGGGHVVQGSVDLGNGLMLLAGLEDLNGTTASAGDVFGTLQYAGSNFRGHITGVAGGVLDGVVTMFGAHVGATANFDNVNLRAAAAVDSTAGVFSYDALASAQLIVDSVTFAIAGEAWTDGAAPLAFSVGGSASWAASTAITLEAGGQYIDPNTTVASDERLTALGRIIWKATDTLTLTAEAGASGPLAGPIVFYGSGELGFSAGGGFTASLKGKGWSNGNFQATIKVADDII
jgi:hypothetical protein